MGTHPHPAAEVEGAVAAPRPRRAEEPELVPALVPVLAVVLRVLGLGLRLVRQRPW